MSLDVVLHRTTPIMHPVHKFGGNSSLAISIESIWSAGGLYPWSAFATPQILYVFSTSALDTGVLSIQGLNSEGKDLTESVVLTGTTPVVTSSSFSRVFRMIHAENVGTITARTVSGAGTIVAQIDEGTGQTLMSVYTIPSNARGYLFQYTVGTGKGDDAELYLYTRESNGFLLKSETTVFESTFTQVFPMPIYLSPSTDIDFRATTTSAGSKCIVNFDLALEYI